MKSCNIFLRILCYAVIKTLNKVKKMFIYSLYSDKHCHFRTGYA